MIKQMTLEDCLTVFRNMREDDKREVLATQWDDDIDCLATRSFNYPGVRYTAFNKNNTPVAAFGVALHTPGVGVAWMVATDDFSGVAIEVSRFGRALIAVLLESEVHRVQAFSAAFHVQSHKWLPVVGLEREDGNVMRQLGRDGEDFYIFAATRKLEGKLCA